MANALARAASPYLLQHSENPVDWREWGTDALAQAKARDVPILLSVGYAACHWCHVMAHESFENPRIAGLMNAGFVNIKVDREERPDLDQIYQNALALLGQQGGWPLTMFLTPDGEPFWGGTYFPPEPRHGRAGFPQVLEQLGRLWREERHKLDGNREKLVQALAEVTRPEPGPALDATLAIEAARRLARSFDTALGGLGGAPKFPQAPVLGLLWRAAALTRDRTLRERVLHTLRRICQGGIYDHLGGGMARYSVDAYWLVPHFEKMLYDNAQLLSGLAEAWAATGDPLFRTRAEETIGWLEREMMVEDAFAASLDADSEGEEGRFYVWDTVEIRALLGPDAAAFELAYGVTEAGNFEGHTILNRLHEPGLPEPALEAGLAHGRALLLDARERRVRPGRDDKVLADWNGLMIQALAEAAFRFDRPDWLAMAQRAFAWIVTSMGEADRLVHSRRGERRLEMAFLDDYAQVARAAVALFETTSDPAYLGRALAWIGTVDRDYRDEAGFYAQTASSGERLLVRPRGAHDGPTPAGVAVLAETSLRLFHLTGDPAHQERADAILAALGGSARANVFGHASLCAAALLAAHPVQLVIVGPPDAEPTRALLDAARASVAPTLILRVVADPAMIPAGHPAAGKGMVGDRPAAYICVGPVCQAPVTEPAALAAGLEAATATGAA